MSDRLKNLLGTATCVVPASIKPQFALNGFAPSMQPSIRWLPLSTAPPLEPDELDRLDEELEDELDDDELLDDELLELDELLDDDDELLLESDEDEEEQLPVS